MTDIKQLLKDVQDIIDAHNASNSGSDKFNIFTILRDEDEEVMLHSRFLFELLNPKGSHNMRQLYLWFFLETIGGSKNISLPGFDYDSLAGSAVYRERQNIDLLIFLSGGYTIIIENKINAGDQEAQLERYYNIVVDQYRRDRDKLFMFYLTLDGHSPSAYSTCNLKHPVYCISYADEIDNWLEQCLLKTTAASLSEVIAQYKSLICRLSNKNSGGDIMNDVSKLILRDINTFKSADSIAKAIGAAKSEIMLKFMRALEKEMNKGGYSTADFDEEGIKNYYVSREYPCQAYFLKDLTEGIGFYFCIEISENLYYYFAFGRKEGGSFKILPKEDIQKSRKDMYEKCKNAVVSIFGDIKKQTPNSIMWEYIYDPLYSRYDFKDFPENCIKLIDNADDEASRICDDLLPLVRQVEKLAGI